MTEIEKYAIVRIIILFFGWPLGLDRFYDGKNFLGVSCLLGWFFTVFIFIYFKCSGYEYIDGVKNYSDYSPNPLIIIPILSAIFGISRVIIKILNLLRIYESGFII